MAQFLSRAVWIKERSLCACAVKRQFKPWVFKQTVLIRGFACLEDLYGYLILPTHRPHRENCVAQIIGPVERFVNWSATGNLLTSEDVARSTALETS